MKKTVLGWRNRTLRWGVVLTGVLYLSTPSLWADDAGDKAGYHLFRPTPRDQMRELSTDRPDQTESPYTVDAGHFQVEMDFINYVHDESGVTTIDAFALVPFNLKVGLLNNVDLQLVYAPYVRERTKIDLSPFAVFASTDDGSGDLVTRLKINLWGNDGGRTAFALLPFVKWPLPQSNLRNGRLEGGISLPLAVALPAGWGLGVMSSFAFVRDGSNAFDTEYFNTITFSHDIVGDLAGYVEFAAVVAPESGGDWQGQVDLGLTYGLCPNSQLDLGCNFGVTEDAPDYNPFLGLTVRF